MRDLKRNVLYIIVTFVKHFNGYFKVISKGQFNSLSNFIKLKNLIKMIDPSAVMVVLTSMSRCISVKGVI